MNRGQGRIYRQQGSRVWWLDYSVRGKRHRESSGTTSHKEAGDILRERIGDRKAGRLIGQPEKVTFAMLRELAERQYELDGRRSLPRLKDALTKLEAFFGAEARALDLTPTANDAYAAQRLDAHAARATVNYELAALRRAFRLAIKKRLLAARPEFELPKVHNERQGFFQEGDFAALLLELAKIDTDVRDYVEFKRYTGWRDNEGLVLDWPDVDRDGEVIRIAARDTKGGEPRLFPYRQAPALKAIIERRWAARNGFLVFHRNGKPIRDYRGAWKVACKRAGLGDRIPHDLRRTAARDMRRAGVSEGEIMKLCGWRTRSMFDRYNIIDEQDLAAAVAKRFAPKAAETAVPTA